MGTEHSSSRLAQHVPSGPRCRFAQKLCPLKSAYVSRCASMRSGDVRRTANKIKFNRVIIATLSAAIFRFVDTREHKNGKEWRMIISQMTFINDSKMTVYESNSKIKFAIFAIFSAKSLCLTFVHTRRSKSSIVHLNINVIFSIDYTSL